MEFISEENGCTEFGVREYFEGKGFFNCEWLSLFRKNLPTEYLKLTFKPSGEDLIEKTHV